MSNISLPKFESLIDKIKFTQTCSKEYLDLLVYDSDVEICVEIALRGYKEHLDILLYERKIGGSNSNFLLAIAYHGYEEHLDYIIDNHLLSVEVKANIIEHGHKRHIEMFKDISAYVTRRAFLIYADELELIKVAERYPRNLFKDSKNIRIHILRNIDSVNDILVHRMIGYEKNTFLSLPNNKKYLDILINDTDDEHLNVFIDEIFKRNLDLIE